MHQSLLSKNLLAKVITLKIELYIQTIIHTYCRSFCTFCKKTGVSLIFRLPLLSKSCFVGAGAVWPHKGRKHWQHWFPVAGDISIHLCMDLMWAVTVLPARRGERVAGCPRGHSRCQPGRCTRLKNSTGIVEDTQVTTQPRLHQCCSHTCLSVHPAHPITSSRHWVSI